jgi:hypothetical protein
LDIEIWFFNCNLSLNLELSGVCIPENAGKYQDQIKWQIKDQAASANIQLACAGAMVSP